MQTNFFHRGADDGPHLRPQPQYDVPVTAGELKKIFSDCDDFEARAVRIGLESRLTVTVCWLDGMVSAGDVSTDVLRPLTEGDRLADIISQKGEMAFTVRIGPETGVPEMADCSIVTATYSTGSGRQGTIGVIGPTRMRYSRVLSVMNTMGQQLSEMFGSQAPQKNKKLDK